MRSGGERPKVKKVRRRREKGRDETLSHSKSAYDAGLTQGTEGMSEGETQSENAGGKESLKYAPPKKEARQNLKNSALFHSTRGAAWGTNAFERCGNGFLNR